MSQEKIKLAEKKYLVARPEVNIGDTVVLNTIIRDGEKQRIQKFKGIVIASKGKGIARTITVRKISYGIGVEKIYPINSPNIESIEIVKHAKIRRSKLYYLRDRIGKAATFLKPGKAVTEESNAIVEVDNGSEPAVKEEEPAKEEKMEGAQEVKEVKTAETKETKAQGQKEVAEEKKKEPKEEKA